MSKSGRATSKRRVVGAWIRFGWLASLGVLLLSLVLECAARIVLYRAGWQDTWDYVTIKDRNLGFRLRAGIQTRFTGVRILTNQDGFRARSAEEHFIPKTGGELLVAVAGDSNSFGAETPYEQTFSAILEKTLQLATGRAVRVLNLAMPAYSTFQSVSLVKQWMHLRPDMLVFTANTFNDRVFLGRRDSTELFRFEYGFTRFYEFGNNISYAILYWYLNHTVPAQIRGAGIPMFDAPIPIPRVPIYDFARLLEDLVGTCRSNSVALVFLTTGNPNEMVESEAGLTAFRGRRYADAFDVFKKLQKEHPTLFLPSYYAYQCAYALGDIAAARAIRTEYELQYKQQSDPYVLNFSYFEAEYFSVIKTVAERDGVPLLDVREEFDTAGIRYSTGHYGGHYGSEGHSLVAKRLLPVVERAIPDQK